jgi:hypothetical protein
MIGRAADLWISVDLAQRLQARSQRGGRSADLRTETASFATLEAALCARPYRDRSGSAAWQPR